MATTVRKGQMYVGGEFVDAADGKTRTITSPATGQVLGEVAEGSAEDVDRAVAAAKTAFETWSDSTPKDRMTGLLALAAIVEENADELGRIESENVGKPFTSVMRDEMPVMTDHLRFFAGASRVMEGRAVGEYFKACLKAGERLPAPSPLLMTLDRTRRSLSSQGLPGDGETRLHLLHALSGLRLALLPGVEFVGAGDLEEPLPHGIDGAPL